MLNRRTFAGLLSSTLAARALAASSFQAQDPAQTSAQAASQTAPQTPIQIAIMAWTLRSHGTFLANLDLIAAAGYHHIQLIDEFRHWSPDETDRILARLKALDIAITAMTGLTGGFADPDPAASDRYLADLGALVPIAGRLGCPNIILMSGKRVSDAPTPSPRQHAAAIDTLRRAAPILAAADLTGLIEPIDRLENPTFYLDNVTEAFAIARSVASPHIRVLYDLYHEQRTHGNLIEKLSGNTDLIGLLHVADVPGRHEPGTGEINFPNIYRKLAELRYTGPIAMEFTPTGDPVPILRRARTEAISLA